ncbi:MAG: hypothetical protein HEQ40_16115 [Lacibacter sp.]|jgi:cytochrome c551/c552
MLRNIIASVLVLVTLLFACRHEPVLINGAPPDVTPPLPGAATICFESNVLPIFVSNCAKSGCHDATTRAKEIQLDNYTDIMRGIKANNPGGSKYWEKIIDNDPKDRMPPLPYKPLSNDQKDSIYKWIVQGALNTTNCGLVCDTMQFSYSITIKSILKNNGCISCHGEIAPFAGLNLTDYETVKAIALNGRLLGSLIQQQPGVYKPMPPPPLKKVSDCNIQQITKWKNAGALNN